MEAPQPGLTDEQLRQMPRAHAVLAIMEEDGVNAATAREIYDSLVAGDDVVDTAEHPTTGPQGNGK